jgi:hypothetical protein
MNTFNRLSGQGDVLAHIEDSFRSGDFEMTEKRIVLIDGHIVAQWFELGKWWTCSRSSNYNESDFAVWSYSEANLTKATKLIGNGWVCQSDLKPVQRRDRWFAFESDLTPKDTYGEALREIARSI